MHGLELFEFVLVSDFTAACYPTMTPEREPIQIMKHVNSDAPILEHNPLGPKEMPLEREGSLYETLVVARHRKQRNR